MTRVLDDFSILKGGHGGNRIAVHISPYRHVAKARFAGMALTVISLVPSAAIFKGDESQWTSAFPSRTVSSVLPSTRSTTRDVHTSPTAPSAQALLFTSNPRADPTCKDVILTVIRDGPHRQGRAVYATESPAAFAPDRAVGGDTCMC